MYISLRDPHRSPYLSRSLVLTHPSTTRALRNSIETMRVLGFEHCFDTIFCNTPRTPIGIYSLCYSAVRLTRDPTPDRPYKATLTYAAEDFTLPQDSHIAPSRRCGT